MPEVPQELSPELLSPEQRMIAAAHKVSREMNVSLERAYDLLFDTAEYLDSEARE